MVLTQASPTAVVQAAIAEFDLQLQKPDWQKGQTIELTHPLFALRHVGADQSSAGAILFQGESFGEVGEISLQFLTLEGDLVYAPPGSLVASRVDKERKTFTVGGVIPQALRGRTGVVQVTFSGMKRAAFLLKVEF